MARILSKASGLFEFIDFCLSGILANKHEYLIYFLLSILSKILHVAFLLPISIHEENSY